MKLKTIGILLCIILSIPVISAINPGISSEISASTDVVIKLVPHNAPIVIQATGGNFDYNIDATNSGSHNAG